VSRIGLSIGMGGIAAKAIARAIKQLIHLRREEGFESSTRARVGPKTAAGRARIAEAQRRRWNKLRKVG
jgi:hypothetical protein